MTAVRAKIGILGMDTSRLQSAVELANSCNMEKALQLLQQHLERV